MRRDGEKNVQDTDRVGKLEIGNKNNTWFTVAGSVIS